MSTVYLSKTVLFQVIQFSQIVLIQLIQRIDFVYTELKVKTVLFQAIQFSISTQELPLQARVGLGAMAMKGYSAFPKAPALLEPHH